MRRFIIGFLLGSLLFGGIAHAYRASRPTPMRLPLDDNQITELNNSIENLWNITNGRYSLNIVTSNPDGTTRGKVGDMLLLSTGGTYYLEINVDNSTTWRGEELTNTP